MERVSVRDLHLKTSALIKNVAQGQIYVIESRGVPVAELRPITARRPTNKLPNREAFIRKRFLGHICFSRSFGRSDPRVWCAPGISTSGQSLISFECGYFQRLPNTEEVKKRKMFPVVGAEPSGTAQSPYVSGSDRIDMAS